LCWWLPLVSINICVFVSILIFSIWTCQNMYQYLQCVWYSLYLNKCSYLYLHGNYKVYTILLSIFVACVYFIVSNVQKKIKNILFLFACVLHSICMCMHTIYYMQCYVLHGICICIYVLHGICICICTKLYFFFLHVYLIVFVFVCILHSICIIYVLYSFCFACVLHSTCIFIGLP
jgi:hypothetical protein